MRTPQDLCLMCNTELATKTKSHIISKFFANSFLTDGKGHKINKSGVKENVIQDSPKENYIFCPSCENYLQLIETPVSKFFKNYHNLKVSHREKKLVSKRSVVKTSDLNENLFHLFFYSLIFRSSISSDAVFTHYKVGSDLTELLRDELMAFKSNTHSELMEKLKNKNINIHLNYIVFTCPVQKDETLAGIGGLSIDKTQLLLANRFVFYSAIELNDHFPEHYWNTEINDTKIVLINIEEWEKILEIYFAAITH